MVRFAGASGNDEIYRLFRSWERQDVEFIAPELLRFEMANAFHRDPIYPKDIDFARRAFEIVDAMNIETVRYPAIHLDALNLAKRFGHSASYDAHYLAVALRKGAEFFTCDRKLAQSVEREYDWVHFVDPVADR